jgi:hypothetical protein
MTKTELVFLEKIIENAVTKAVNEALEKGVKKEIREIKLLTAKIIKEGLMTGNQKQSVFQPISKTAVRLSESSDMKTISRTTEDIKTMPVLPASMAAHYEKTMDLPDIDAPIFFDPNSNIFKEVKEKYSK